ncbi:MAG: lysoplasmalogenase [Gelidibacter sp.]|nr:lysoplasmalogenase [Gelidibacter sp.]
MNAITYPKFTLLFIGILCAELICGSIESLQTAHYFTKPALLISLVVFFYSESKQLSKSIRRFTLLALSFSLLGDVLLLFVEQSANYFMFGLMAFLLAHIMYILVFSKHRNKTKNPWVFVLLLLIFAMGIFYLLKSGLGTMRIPVSIYMLIILTMVTMAFLRKGMVNPISYNLVLIGGFLFLVSDSILALNKFYQPLPLSNFSIMTTYALAQYFIVKGLLKLQ